MIRGYTALIGNQYVFVPAKNIAEAEIKLYEQCNGKEWIMDRTRQFKVLES